MISSTAHKLPAQQGEESLGEEPCGRGGEQSGGGGASYAEEPGLAGEGCGQAEALLWGVGCVAWECPQSLLQSQPFLFAS